MIPPFAAKILSRALNFLLLAGKKSHGANVSKSRKLLRKLSEFAHEMQILAYLRKIDPNLFEEAVLTAFENSGFVVLRNRRYSGDGGVDGRVWLPGFGLCPVQAKRYAEHISLSHVQSFETLLARRNKKAGVFVHTGKTGAGSKITMQTALILSGADLSNLIRGQLSAADWLRAAASRRAGRRNALASRRQQNAKPDSRP